MNPIRVSAVMAAAAEGAWREAATNGNVLFFKEKRQTHDDVGTFKTMKDEDKRTPMHYAATAKNEENAQEVIRFMCVTTGARSALTAADDAGWMPLHCAASAGRAENVGVMLAFILEEEDDEEIAEATLLARTDNGGTPLHYAASKGHEFVIEKLLGAGDAYRTKQLKAKDKRGDTALHRACAAGRIAAAKAIIDAAESGAQSTQGASAAFNVKNATGATPLILALGSGHGRVALMLAARGADPEDIPEDMQKESVGADMMGLLRRAAAGELDDDFSSAA